MHYYLSAFSGLAGARPPDPDAERRLRRRVRMLLEAGAREVHVRITSPPVRWPCFYGIDMPTRAELVASDLLSDEVAS